MLNSAGLRHTGQMGVCVQGQSNRPKTPAGTSRTQNPQPTTGSHVGTGRAAGCTPVPQPERPRARQRCWPGREGTGSPTTGVSPDEEAQFVWTQGWPWSMTYVEELRTVTRLNLSHNVNLWTVWMYYLFKRTKIKHVCNLLTAPLQYNVHASVLSIPFRNF